MSGDLGPLDPNERCPASGLTNRECVGSICDCFPAEDDRFGLHPEYFRVEDWGPPEPFAMGTVVDVVPEFEENDR